MNRKVLVMRDGRVGPATLTPDTDPREIYEALENLYGDLCLLGLAEITLENIYEGSSPEALKILKRHQRFRHEGLQHTAIGCARKGAGADKN